MTDSERWWEAELPELEKRIRKDLHYRYPALSADHDDLVNKTLLRLTEVMRRNKTAEHPHVSNLYALARVIARNFAFDLVRTAVRERRASVDPDVVLNSLEDDSPAADERVDIAMALETVIEVLADSSAEDRELFVRMIGESSAVDASMTVRQRQRAVRLRREMIKRLDARFGGAALASLRSAQPRAGDDLLARVPTDRTTINTTEEYEVRYWCSHLGCTRAQLLACVARVGTRAADVRRCLEK